MTLINPEEELASTQGLLALDLRPFARCCFGLDRYMPVLLSVHWPPQRANMHGR